MFRRSIAEFNDRPHWFFEYSASATASVPDGGPSVLAAGNSSGNIYHCTLASDKIYLSGDANLPGFLADVDGTVPKTVRLELFNDPPPTTFHWYLDSQLVLEGLADSPFPDKNSRITWGGKTKIEPSINAWFYIRAGDIPINGSADFNSDGQVDEFEVFYIDQCIQRSAAGEPADPNCHWSDINADNTVDCTDWQTIKETLWTGSFAPPPIAPCDPINEVETVPAVSHWGLTILALRLATFARLDYGHRFVVA